MELVPPAGCLRSFRLHADRGDVPPLRGQELMHLSRWHGVPTMAECDSEGRRPRNEQLYPAGFQTADRRVDGVLHQINACLGSFSRFYRLRKISAHRGVRRHAGRCWEVPGGISGNADAHDQLIAIQPRGLLKAPARIGIARLRPIIGSPPALACWDFQLESNCRAQGPAERKGPPGDPDCQQRTRLGQSLGQ